MHTRILIYDMMHQKPWTSMINETNRLTLIVLMASTMTPQSNVSNQIFILANIKYNYEMFEAY